MRLDIRVFPAVTLVRVAGGASARDLRVLEAGLLQRAPRGRPLILNMTTAQLEKEALSRLPFLKDSLEADRTSVFIVGAGEPATAEPCTLKSALERTVGADSAAVLELLELEEELVNLDAEEDELLGRATSAANPGTEEDLSHDVAVLEHLVATARESVQKDEELCLRFLAEADARSLVRSELAKLKTRALGLMRERGVPIAARKESA